MRLCDENCNNCPLMTSPNSRMLSKIMNEAQKQFGDEFYLLVSKNCPTMTICKDCRIDDFCHNEDCEIMAEIEKESPI
jgi:hypothetical protein